MDEIHRDGSRALTGWACSSRKFRRGGSSAGRPWLEFVDRPVNHQLRQTRAEHPSVRSEREPQGKSERTTVIERVRDPSKVGFCQVRAGTLELRVIREVERLGPEQQSVVTA